MKTPLRFRITLCCAAFLALALLPARPAPPDKKPKTPHGSQTNSLPQSVFTIPASLKEGRDPFFPDSAYWLGGGGGVMKLSPTKHIDVGLVLNGLSGPNDHRLAMINGRTVAEGEEAEVSTSTGRVKVRCVQIKSDAVILEIGGERKELRLRD